MVKIKRLATKGSFQKGHKGYWLGKKKPISLEIRKKISKTLSGHSVSKETREKISLKNKGNVAWNKGRPWSDEMKERISQTNKRRCIEPKKKFVGFGTDHPRWKGGVNSENRMIRGRIEFRLWREAVFARDGWTCQRCKEKGKYLHPHHILNFAQYPELRFAIDNGTTLCKKCHREFHKKYGTKDNTKGQIEEFLKI